MTTRELWKTQLIISASLKGGSGKSLCAKNFSVLFAQAKGRRNGEMVAVPNTIIDLDPQLTSYNFAKVRKNEKSDEIVDINFAAADSVNELHKSIELANKHYSKYTIIDTPPLHKGQAVIFEALRLAKDYNGIVIIPTRLTIEDLQVCKKTMDLCEKQEIPFIVITSQTEVRRASYKLGIEQLETAIANYDYGLLCPHTMRNLADHINSGFAYRVAAEMFRTSDAAKDSIAVSKYVQKIAIEIKKGLSVLDIKQAENPAQEELAVVNN